MTCSYHATFHSPGCENSEQDLACKQLTLQTNINGEDAFVSTVCDCTHCTVCAEEMRVDACAVCVCVTAY